MSFNIVIPTHCRTKLLKRTLASLVYATKPEGFEHVIVIENGSNDGAELICKQFSNELPLIYKYQSQPGKGRAVQSVMKDLKKGFVLFLDDDVSVCSDLLIHYSSAIRKYGSNCVYGGPLLIDHEVEPEKWLIKYLPLSAIGFLYKEQMDFFLGANFGAFVEDILEVGGFSSDIGPGSHSEGIEVSATGLERDIQYRLQDAGKKQCFLKGAKVWHFVPRSRCSPSWVLHRIYRNQFSRIYLKEKNNDDMTRRWNGAPIILWVRYPLYGFIALMAYFMPIAEYRFKMQRDFFKLRGKIKGHQHARQ